VLERRRKIGCQGIKEMPVKIWAIEGQIEELRRGENVERIFFCVSITEDMKWSESTEQKAGSY
jgi:hypothetical protein